MNKLFMSLCLFFNIINCASDKRESRRSRIAQLESASKITTDKLKTEQEQKRKNLNKEAEEAFKVGKIAKAIKLIRKSLKLSPDYNATGNVIASRIFAEQRLEFLEKAIKSKQSILDSEGKAQALKNLKSTNSKIHIESIIKKYTEYIEEREKVYKKYKELKDKKEDYQEYKKQLKILDTDFDTLLENEKIRAANPHLFDLLVSDLISQNLNPDLNSYLFEE